MSFFTLRKSEALISLEAMSAPLSYHRPSSSSSSSPLDLSLSVMDSKDGLSPSRSSKASDRPTSFQRRAGRLDEQSEERGGESRGKEEEAGTLRQMKLLYQEQNKIHRSESGLK